MPAVHISEFINLKSKTELKLNSFTILNALLAKISMHRASPLVILFPNGDALEDAFHYAQAIQNLPLLENSSFSTAIEPHQGPSLCKWPSWEHSASSPIASSLTQRIERIKTLASLQRFRNTTIFATAESWIQPTLPKEVFLKNILPLKKGEALSSRDHFLQQLKAMGYQKADPVEEPGQFSFRGEIIDVYCPAANSPYRIELFDTEIEKIRNFSVESQRTFPLEMNEIEIFPAEEALFPWDEVYPLLERVKEFCDQHHVSRKIRDPIFENIRQGFLPENFRTWLPFIYSRVGRLEEYLPAESLVALIEPEQLEIKLKETLNFFKQEESRYEKTHWIAPPETALYPEPLALWEKTREDAALCARASPLEPERALEVAFDRIDEQKISLSSIAEWVEDGFEVQIGSKSISQQERLKFFLNEWSNHPAIKLISHPIQESSLLLIDKTVLLSDTKLLGGSPNPSRASKTAKRSAKNPLSAGDFQSLQELKVGDSVVHTLHGVGKYLGLQELSTQGSSRGEYLILEYAQGDRLYLPVYRLNVIQKHVGAHANPVLDRLGTQQFEKAKQKAKESARKLAVNLLEIYAKRAVTRGPVFSERDESYDRFCEEFDFTETEGQMNATEDVLQDLETGKLLDRLVCGDVGFGKTEVAMRAAFQAVQNGFQVAVLVPTTLLAFQHEQTFKRRMKSFPIVIESLSRFKTKKEQKQILEDLRQGKVDILIGTHRLLSKDIHFAKLGLLIVDEEHRFGVDHKEKIKEIQANTHTLTLTATPIPRTLNMAISGIKDISLIRTPPTNRQPIKTFISSQSLELIKSAIETELSRGGQVFYLHNRVSSIEHQARELKRLVPQAAILTAHGQMTEDEIESRMLAFYQGQAQVLVSTTIIESGIDIPNAGTIIIERADQLGLAQLYQIRGRVGRSHRKAFAYLMVHDTEILKQDARLRLEALQKFVELGSGFQIASEDLEIRGGGNLLGPEQSGHIASVGLDLFTELLEDSIRELRNQGGAPAEERHFEPEIQIPVVCEIPSTLVPDAQMRLSLYRKLSRTQTEAQIDDLQNEFTDRFGNLPPETENLFWLIRLKNTLKKAGIESIVIGETKTVFTVRKTSLIDLHQVMLVVSGPKSKRDPRVSLTPESKIILALPFVSVKEHSFEIEKLLIKIAPKAFDITNSH